MEVINIKHIRNAVSELVDLPCWGIIAGKGSGSMVSLYFGEIVARKRPLKNPNLSDKLRKNESSHSVMLWSGWQLFHRGHLLCEWTNSNLENKFYDILQLEGKILINFEIVETDKIQLTFSENYQLSVFASSADDNSISVFTPVKSITVRGDGYLE